MQNGMFVIDSPVHPADFSEPNRNPHQGAGELFVDLCYAVHSGWNPPDITIPKESFATNCTVEALAYLLFTESNTDMGVIHHLPLYSWLLDGMVSREKVVEASRRWPDRFLTYAGIDPTRGIDVAMRSLDEQMEECPTNVGLKLYPSQIDPTYASYRMDDEKLMFPIYEKCVEYGIKAVATHKALPLGPVPVNPYRPDDVGGAAGAFPSLSFEIVHSGLAFLDETAQSLACYPNVYANLEVTFLLMNKAPGMFEETLASLMFWGGPDKIIYSSGATLGHPQPVLEKFADFQFSEATMHKYGVAPLTPEDRAKVLGGNAARMLGVDVEAAKAKIADDEWAQRRAERNALVAPYSALEMSVGSADKCPVVGVQ